ncbi:MAG: enoyl-CoA hydratase-related protein [Dehalococcoidia bacterium]|nr:enoyl-CoA hydratase-related protein [Dehalococcoidia bacterium]
MQAPKVLVERQGPVLVVTINRPEVRNCVDGEAAALLEEAAEAFRRDPQLRSMVLTGAGGHFCSGADLKAIDTLASRPGADRSGPMGLTRITDVGKPTIAAISGYCLAGGLELALWCDFRIADTTARFGVTNRRWGVPLVDGGTQRLPRVVGLGNALYLILSGVLIDAQRAYQMGLVQELVPAGQALSRALEVAQRMAEYPQTSMRLDRLAALWGFSLPLEQGLQLEAYLHRESLRDPAMREWLERYARGERPPPLEPPPTG